METTLKTTAFIWVAICAVSHVRIDAKKKGEDLSLKSQGIWYVVQTLIYWSITAVII